jgi:hypothetical protein
LREILNEIPNLLKISPLQRPTAKQLALTLRSPGPELRLDLLSLTPSPTTKPTIPDHTLTKTETLGPRSVLTESDRAPCSHNDTKSTLDTSRDKGTTATGISSVEPLDEKEDTSDTDSKYTQRTKIDPSREATYNHEFATLISNSLQIPDAASIQQNNSSLAFLLQSFATRLVHTRTDNVDDMAIFIYKNRGYVSVRVREYA